MEEASVRRAGPARTRMRRLFSLSGVVPLGAFLVLHLWTSAALLTSHQVHARQMAWLHGGPLLGLLEVVLVLIPLAFHGGYGLWLAAQPREADSAGYDSDLSRVLERVTGVIALLFIAAHLWETRGQTWTAGLPASSYATTLIERLSTLTWGLPLVALGHLVGIAATVFHLVNGLSSFCLTWGLTPGAAAQRRARLLFRAGGGMFFLVASATVIQLATGTRFFPAEDRSTNVVCGSAAVSPPPASRPTRSVPSALPGAGP